MTDEKFDQMMRQALSPDSVPESLLMKTTQKMEERTMRKISKNNKVLIVLACCLALTTIAAGAAQLIRHGTIAHSTNNEFQNYKQLNQVLKELGYRCNVPEQLPGGYKFQSMSIVHEAAIDDNDVKLHKYKGLTVVYQDETGSEVYLDTARKADEDFGVEKAEIIKGNSGTVNGIPIDVNVQKYKLVPPDYQPGADEIAARDAGELFISYGSDKVENLLIANARFVIDGISYTLLDMEHADKGQLLEMAKTVIDF